MIFVNLKCAVIRVSDTMILVVFEGIWFKFSRFALEHHVRSWRSTRLSSEDSPIRSICLWFSSMWSWMSGWDSKTRKTVPTHPWNHMNLFNTPIGTCDKNLASWFELYRICFVTGLASRFLRFSSSSTFVCLVVYWKKETDCDLAMKMSDHWDTLDHTWCGSAIWNSRI